MFRTNIHKGIYKVAQSGFARVIGNKKKIISIFGLRRSGNHAAIDYISSGLIGHKIHWRQGRGHNFLFSQDGEIAFINEANWLSARFLILGLIQNIREIRAAEYFLISFEDTSPVTQQPYWRDIGKTRVILIRDALELMASQV